MITMMKDDAVDDDDADDDDNDGGDVGAEGDEEMRAQKLWQIFIDKQLFDFPICFRRDRP